MCPLLPLLSVVASAAGIDTERPQPDLPASAAGYLSVKVENDMFTSGNDRHFTHGLKAGWVSERCQLGWVGPLARLLGLTALDERGCGGARVGLGVGQAIYTPVNLNWSEPDPRDRPYAGWLYLAGSLYAETHRDEGALRDRALVRFELSLGVVGPASGASEMQRAWHQLVGAPRPRGWRNQLQNEAAVMFTWEYLRRFGRRLGRYLELDVTPAAGLSLGNVFSQATVGMTIRVGHDMAGDWGPERGFFEAPGSGFSWYLFAGTELRGVAHDVFLDGNTYVDGPRVDKRPFVADARFGLAVCLSRVRLTYTMVLRSPQFSGQRQLDDFGALGLTAGW